METLRKEMKQTKLLAEVRLLDCLRQAAHSCLLPSPRRHPHSRQLILILANSSNLVDLPTSFHLLMLADSILLFTYPLPSALLAIIHSLAIVHSLAVIHSLAILTRSPILYGRVAF